MRAKRIRRRKKRTRRRRRRRRRRSKKEEEEEVQFLTTSNFVCFVEAVENKIAACFIGDALSRATHPLPTETGGPCWGRER